MHKIAERPILVVSLLILVSAYLFFFQSGRLALTDPDETFYAQTAKEMLAKGEWHTPYLYGNPQFEKPILFYWLVEASFRIFGVNEFAARLPSAIFALLGLIAAYLLGKLLFNARVGLFSAAMLATSVEYIILSRACVTDMVLGTLMLWGAFFFLYGYLKKGKEYFYILSGAAFALATLTKGPIAIMLAGAVIATYLFVRRDLVKTLSRPYLLLGMAAFVVITAPWYILMYKMHGKAFIEAFFGFHNVTRFLQAEHKIGSQFYYNIPILFGGFFPWSVFLPLGFWNIFKKIQNPKSKIQNEKIGSIFILLWFFVIFTFFSVSSTKLPTYIFPCFISLAVITAVFWDDFLKSASKNIAMEMKISYYLLLAVVLSGAIGAAIYINYDYPAVLKGVMTSSLFLIFGMAASAAAFINKKFIPALLFIVYSVAIFLYPFGELVLPEIERRETSKEIAGHLAALMKPGEALGSESNYLAGLAFYTGAIPTDIDRHHVLVQFIGSDERVWCVLKEKNQKELYDLDTPAPYAKASYMVYKLGKKAIITNKVPDDGVYIVKREKKR